MAQDNSVVMEDVRLIFRNFEGREGQYNREGDRNFCVLLPQDVAKRMEKDGWNIKTLEPRDEGDEEEYYLPVSLNFNKGRPPRVVLVTSRGRTTLREDEVEMLDWADLETVDLIVNPYEWKVSGKSGVKAYLRSLYATIVEDALERKYGATDDE